MSQSIPFLVAHRGYPLCYPENSREGILAALRSGACFVEFDMQFSADGIPVVIHDEFLDRTAGRNLSVLDTRFSDLKQISVGETDRFGGRFNHSLLPSLEEIVEIFTDWPHAQAVVEIKRHSLKRFGHDAIVKTLGKLLQPIREQSIVISFDYDVGFEFKRNGEYKMGWILEAYNDQVREQVEALKPDYLVIKDERIPPSVELLWSGPWQWMIYLTNDAQTALTLSGLGANLIETNAIGEMLEHPLLKQKACIHE
jgi:glycerophosphoryl diester phosphodiesterase